MEEIWPDDELRGDLAKLAKNTFFQNVLKLRTFFTFFSQNVSKYWEDFLGFYIPKNPVARLIQCAAIASENEVQ